EPDWFQGGWERLTVELELKPMPDDDSLRLLHERGVKDDALAAEMCGWSGGSPLALTLAADAARSGGSWDQGRLEGSPELVRGLIRHLVSSELEGGGNRDVLAVAALARTTTRRLLAAVLPDADDAE